MRKVDRERGWGIKSQLPMGARSQFGEGDKVADWRRRGRDLKFDDRVKMVAGVRGV